MKIVFCAAEASPFAKVGGLGDVVGSLPKALAKHGEEVIVCIPCYGSISSENFHLVDTDIRFNVLHKGREFSIHVLETMLPYSNVPVYFFGNMELYGQSREIYPQVDPVFEALRFEVLGKAILQFLKQIAWQPNIMHIHDWHTSNIAVYLKEFYREDPFFKNTGTVLTIHNMAYQGITDDINWLKEGLIHSDVLVAVSPNYSREILTEQSGAGLESVLQNHKNKLRGILNGIDRHMFNPATDLFIPRQYDSSTFKEGKALCKSALQMELGLQQTDEIPLFGMVSRIVEQKGFDLLLEAIPELVCFPAQFVILGRGQECYEQQLKSLNRLSKNIRCVMDYNMSLSQHIYAGSDMFLMPSRFEPCGLGQMIALRYGSVPVARKTGGLADTVFDIDANPENGNGFVFNNYNVEEFLTTLTRATQAWQKNDSKWREVVRRGMEQNFSWEKSASAYSAMYRNVYEHALQRI